MKVLRRYAMIVAAALVGAAVGLIGMTTVAIQSGGSSDVWILDFGIQLHHQSGPPGTIEDVSRAWTCIIGGVFAILGVTAFYLALRIVSKGRATTL